MSLDNLLPDSLAAYRIGRLVATEDGPGNIFHRLREDYTTGWLAEGVKCPLCVSVWAALAMPLFPRSVRYALAVAGGASLIFDYVGVPEDADDYNAAEMVAHDVKSIAEAYRDEGVFDEGDFKTFLHYVDQSLQLRDG